MGDFAPNTEINANTDIISHRKKEHYHRVEMNYRLGRSTGAFGAELNYTPTICNNVPNPPPTRMSVILVGDGRGGRCSRPTPDRGSRSSAISINVAA